MGCRISAGDVRRAGCGTGRVAEQRRLGPGYCWAGEAEISASKAA